MEGERHPKCKLDPCNPDCLERAECTEATDMFCGMCPEHDRPRHDCGCAQGAEHEEKWPTETMRYEAEWDEKDTDRTLWDQDFYRELNKM